jgi:hypothetical protein
MHGPRIKHPFTSIIKESTRCCQNRFRFKTEILGLKIHKKNCYWCMKTLDYWLNKSYKHAETKIESKRNLKRVIKTMFFGWTWRTFNSKNPEMPFWSFKLLVFDLNKPHCHIHNVLIKTNNKKPQIMENIHEIPKTKTPTLLTTNQYIKFTSKTNSLGQKSSSGTKDMS